MTDISVAPSRDDYDAELFQKLDELMASCPPKDRLLILITACIDQGIDTRARLLWIANEKGFTRGQFMKTLNDNTCDSPARCHWSRDGDRRYHNLG